MLKPNNMENRVIKFRAWIDKDDRAGAMVYLPLAGLQYFDFEGSYALSFAVDGYDGFWAHECYDGIKPEYKLMQFTGLHDKNGKEIYEGDIFGAEDECLVILWSDGWAKFQVHIYGFDTYHNEGGGEEVNTKRTVLSTDDIEPFELEQYEIIGNIYENPELLK